MSLCIFNQQRHRADEIQNTATSPMLIMKLSIIFALFIFSSSFAQTNRYQNLLDIALKGHGSLFLCKKPLEITRLDPTEMWFYFENVQDYSNQRLDTVIFSQIIQNAKAADTTLWTDSELPNFILVNKRA